MKTTQSRLVEIPRITHFLHLDSSLVLPASFGCELDNLLSANFKYVLRARLIIALHVFALRTWSLAYNIPRISPHSLRPPSSISSNLPVCGIP
jgi:hypothetical protein